MQNNEGRNLKATTTITETFRNPRRMIDYIRYRMSLGFNVQEVSFKSGWLFDYYTVMMKRDDVHLNIEVVSVSQKINF